MKDFLSVVGLVVTLTMYPITLLYFAAWDENYCPAGKAIHNTIYFPTEGCSK